MRLHYLQHVPFEDLGRIAQWADLHEFEVTRTRLFAGEDLPDFSDFDWLFVMGGPMSVHDIEEHPWLREEKRFIHRAVDRGRPVVGICLGAQLLAEELGAQVYPHGAKEIGWLPLTQVPKELPKPFDGFPSQFTAFHWHGDTFTLPKGSTHLFQSEVCENQGFIYGDRVVGLQFHLEYSQNNTEAMLKHCAEELEQGGATVQTPDEIRGMYAYIATTRNLLTSFLDNLLDMVGS